MWRIGFLVVSGCIALVACVAPEQSAPVEPAGLVEEPIVQAESYAVAPMPALEVATVTHVCDGDTVVVSFDEDGDGVEERVKVRLIGVSTPEIGKPYSEMASVYLESLVLGKTVFMEREGLEEQAASGHYPRRLLRHLFVEDPETGSRIHVNAALVEAGYATSTPHGNVRYKTTFEQREHEARMAKRGRWAPKPRKTAVRYPSDRSSFPSLRDNVS